MAKKSHTEDYMAAPHAPIIDPKATNPSHEPWTITLCGEASGQIDRLSDATGHSVESLLEISISLLGIVADAKSGKRKIFLSTRRGVPLKEIVIPPPIEKAS